MNLIMSRPARSTAAAIQQGAEPLARSFYAAQLQYLTVLGGTLPYPRVTLHTLVQLSEKGKFLPIMW